MVQKLPSVLILLLSFSCGNHEKAYENKLAVLYSRQAQDYWEILTAFKIDAKSNKVERNMQRLIDVEFFDHKIDSLVQQLDYRDLDEVKSDVTKFLDHYLATVDPKFDYAIFLNDTDTKALLKLEL